ncbi:unnamed protein product [Mytilus coruscus]|uniref:C-type lectin domain-containing protein n=1 Tax=Mytilus coruscus TaxID=42192 RepID=A0A6J8BF75_MYTCO|nr:unnamed protein product [Mytilus coruscus]
MDTTGILTVVLFALFSLATSQCISKEDETVFDNLQSKLTTSENNLGQVRVQLTSLENKLKKKTAPTCEPGWLSYQGSCYFFSKNTDTWVNAERECRQKSSNLVKIESATENIWLKQKSKATKKQRWIGAREVNGQWEWVSDLAPLTFTSWAGNEPNSAKENCGHIDKGKSYNWNDHKCTMRFNFICEKAAGQ